MKGMKSGRLRRRESCGHARQTVRSRRRVRPRPPVARRPRHGHGTDTDSTSAKRARNRSGSLTPGDDSTPLETSMPPTPGEASARETLSGPMPPATSRSGVGVGRPASPASPGSTRVGVFPSPPSTVQSKARPVPPSRPRHRASTSTTGEIAARRRHVGGQFAARRDPSVDRHHREHGHSRGQIDARGVRGEQRRPVFIPVQLDHVQADLQRDLAHSHQGETGEHPDGQRPAPPVDRRAGRDRPVPGGDQTAAPVKRDTARTVGEHEPQPPRAQFAGEGDVVLSGETADLDDRPATGGLRRVDRWTPCMIRRHNQQPRVRRYGASSNGTSISRISCSVVLPKMRSCRNECPCMPMNTRSAGYSSSSSSAANTGSPARTRYSQ